MDMWLTLAVCVIAALIIFYFCAVLSSIKRHSSYLTPPLTSNELLRKNNNYTRGGCYCPGVIRKNIPEFEDES